MAAPGLVDVPLHAAGVQAEVGQLQPVAGGERMVRGEDGEARFCGQCLRVQAGPVERRVDQGDVRLAAAQQPRLLLPPAQPDGDRYGPGLTRVARQDRLQQPRVPVGLHGQHQLRLLRRPPGPPPGGLQGVQCDAGLGEQDVPGRGPGDTVGGPLEQRDTQLGLQAADRPGQGRRGDAQPLGGAREVQLLGDRHEVAQGTRLHAPFPSGLGHGPVLP